jgi:hypothetical protein
MEGPMLAITPCSITAILIHNRRIDTLILAPYSPNKRVLH